MASKKRLIDPNDVYALFGENGMARLHVGDIDQINRVDAVEVVRCRDCKKYGVGNICNMWSIPYYTHMEDFCSYGERKDGQ